MAFSIEQIFLTDGSGKLLVQSPAATYHVVEAETVDDALASFLHRNEARILGTVQRCPGDQAVATAQQRQTVFTLYVAGAGAFDPGPRIPIRRDGV